MYTAFGRNDVGTALNSVEHTSPNTSMLVQDDVGMTGLSALEATHPSKTTCCQEAITIKICGFTYMAEHRWRCVLQGMSQPGSGFTNFWGQEHVGAYLEVRVVEQIAV